MASGGAALESNGSSRKSYIVENKSGLKRKFDFYKTGITTFDKFHWKTVLYLISFCLRLVEKIVAKYLK